MAEVLWSESASRQLDRIVAYIEMSDPDAALDVGARLLALGESLTDFPDRGRPAGRFRELVTVPPYVLRYSVKGEIVTIRSVRHGRRRPLKA